MLSPPAISYTERLAQVTELDPLGLEQFVVHELAGVNREQDQGALIMVTRQAVEAVLDTDFNEDSKVAQAALRDMDFLASSLAPMNIGIDQVDRLELAMSQLGRLAGTVPRGTVYTYTLQNPLQQERTFTDTDEEHFFIDTVRNSARIMLGQCADLISLDPRIDESDAIAASLERSKQAMKSVVEGMVEVSRFVPPNFFSTVMRPFFDELVIDNGTYAGAGGAQLPLVVIDWLIWGSDSESTTYQDYFIDNIKYQPTLLRESLGSAVAAPYSRSLLGNLRTRQALGEDMSAATAEVRGLMKQVKRFRMPHRKVAKDNFKLRSADAVGSGQYTPSILDILIDETEIAIAATDPRNFMLREKVVVE